MTGLSFGWTLPLPNFYSNVQSETIKKHIVNVELPTCSACSTNDCLPSGVGSFILNVTKALWDGKNYSPIVEPLSQTDILGKGCYRGTGKQLSSDKHQSSPAGEMMRPRSKIKIMSNL